MPNRTHPRRRTSSALVALALTAIACSTPPPADHAHRHTDTVTVTEQALLPSATVSIPAFATVVWRNRSTREMSIEVEAAACPDCDTVLSFTASEHGARSALIAPGAVATLCFHAVGTFPYTARLGDIEHRGTVAVGGPR